MSCSAFRESLCRLGFSLLAAFLVIQNSFAETPPELPSVITISAVTDSDNSSEFYLASDVALPDAQRLSMTAGKINLAQNQFNTGLDPLDFIVALNSRPGLTFPAGVEYELWGEEGEFTIQALRGSLGFNHKWFSFSARPHVREFAMYFEGGRKLKFYGEGYDFNLNIHGIKNVLISLGYSKNDYDFTNLKLLSLLAKRETDVFRRLIELRAMYIVGQRLRGADNFDDRVYNVGVNYFFSWGDAGAYWIRSRSVIKDPDSGDQIMRQLYGITTTFDLTPDWSLGLQVGSQTASNDNTTLTSGSASLSYFW